VAHFQVPAGTLPSNEDEGAPFIELLIFLALWNARLDLVFLLLTRRLSFTLNTIFTPNALSTLRIVSKRGFAPEFNALYKLSLPRPDSDAILLIPRALAISQ